MASYNRVILVGNLTRDPELRYIPSGTAVTEITMAISDRRKDQSGNWIEETTFINVTLWARTAEVVCEYLSKGSSVLIEGRLKFETWEKDGQKHSKLKVIGDRMQMLGSRGGSGGGSGGDGGGGSSTTSSQPAEYQQPAAEHQQPAAEHQQPPAEYQQPPDEYEQPAATAAASEPAGDDIPF